MENNTRVIIATALSMAVLLAWAYFFSPVIQPIDTPPAAQAPAQVQGQAPVQAEGQAPAAPQAAATPAADAAPVLTGKPVLVRTPLYEAKLTQGGVLEHFTLSQYRQAIAKDSPYVDLVTPAALAKAPLGLIWNGQPTWSQGQWSVEGGDLNLAAGQTGTITLVGELSGLMVRRELTFQADSYLVRETVRLRNSTAAQLQGKLAFTLASASLSPKGDKYNQTRIDYLTAKGRESKSDAKDLGQGVSYAGQLRWGSVASNYFLLALIPSMEETTFKARLAEDVYRAAVEKDGVLIDPKGETALRMDYFLGPKSRDRLAAAPSELDKAIDYGWFSFISLPLIKFLNWLYGFVGNYGVAIIILTTVIKLVFWPLSQKSYASMNQMKKIQPMMEKIREKYADDRERMNQEIMQLYKTYKVNPMGGCLPMVVQIPVFIGLYQALLNAIELRHAPFLAQLPFTSLPWLADLSVKDPYYITPLIMGATMFLQQLMTPAAGDPTQQKVMMFMPIIFTFMFINFPAGLVLYWLVNNILSIAQQWWMTRASA